MLSIVCLLDLNTKGKDMDLFSDPVAVCMALLALTVSFALPVGIAFVIIKRLGLWDMTKKEINANRENK